MRHVIISMLLLGLGACRSDATEQPEPTVVEYADWYALKAPEAREIVAVAGDIDHTLTIATRFHVYLTTDRGQSWQTGSYAPPYLGLFGFATRPDTLLALTTGTYASDSATTYASYPSYYSLDQGRQWQPYRFRSTAAAPTGLRVPLNRVRTPTGRTYRIAVRQVPVSPTSSSSYIITTGIQPDGGALLTLPQEHQIYSLHLDPQARLYVAASAPLSGQGKEYGLLGDANGILYVSKKPLP